LYSNIFALFSDLLVDLRICLFLLGVHLISYISYCMPCTMYELL